MNASRSDASTDTADDVKGRPLCLFYFTHPFGVLSPEAPRVYDMESAPPFCWPPSDTTYVSTSPTAPPRRVPGLESTSETWCSSECGRRALPYARMLPPLRLPSPRDLFDASEEDIWPCRRRPPPPRFSLPPIELPPAPAPTVHRQPALPPPPRAVPPGAAPGGTPRATPRARRSRLSHAAASRVDKHRRHHRRVRAGDLRRLLSRLIRRAITEVVRKMVQEVLERAPVLHACCCCVPLRAGVLAVAVAGLGWAGGYLGLHCGRGAAWLGAHGAGGTGWQTVHGAAGVLLATLHALLLAGALRRPELLELYAWAMLPLSLVLLLAGTVLAFAALLAGQLLFATGTILVLLVAVSFAMYFVVVTINYRMTLP